MYFSVLLIHHKGFFSNKAAIFVVYFHGLGCIRGVVGEGMPAYRRPYDRGNLYVKFEIEFPPNNFIPGDKISVSTYSYLFTNFLRFSTIQDLLLFGISILHVGRVMM